MENRRPPEELPTLEVPSCDAIWDPEALAAALDRMEAAADRLMAEVFRSPWW